MGPCSPQPHIWQVHPLLKCMLNKHSSFVRAPYPSLWGQNSVKRWSWGVHRSGWERSSLLANTIGLAFGEYRTVGSLYRERQLNGAAWSVNRGGTKAALIRQWGPWPTWLGYKRALKGGLMSMWCPAEGPVRWKCRNCHDLMTAPPWLLPDGAHCAHIIRRGHRRARGLGQSNRAPGSR